MLRGWMCSVVSSDLTFSPAGHFRYSGLNALGRPVAFLGTYATGVDHGTGWIALYYDDYTGGPKAWFYMLDGQQLKVSAIRGNLTNGTAMVFTR